MKILLVVLVITIFILIAFREDPLTRELNRPRFQCLCTSGMVNWYCPACQLAIRRGDVNFRCLECHAVHPDEDDMLSRAAQN